MNKLAGAKLLSPFFIVSALFILLGCGETHDRTPTTITLKTGQVLECPKGTVTQTDLDVQRVYCRQDEKTVRIMWEDIKSITRLNQ
ncbi:hypothetical protein A3G55_01450 [Candidatus Giovannonibacteria bacterium RIFCSPLOWO2_12_FULL_44_25]|uniref:Lipoprotein n=3 Tax=Parcubacteria group TaxID=1794811 RepID=A0A837IK18_9BACT|nr:MAG: hypothetical protein UW15_C0010G0018 [Parcubacteria group bacterium GW2011_GWC1_44_10]KKT60114.1 MAG: hypothetical protein UW53_C0003G0025 [Candidatus Giovannonibacteria bacterium GW2011_GWA1_44_25]KKU12859.1 MAG: hypothetical protein UX18_C0008G0005 [Candidatus Azambacteria bacterium GW2011_GWC2_45_7b]KKU29961.1 MAG: hypothetical protein UX43_C0003G0054 [Candidatus Giovannonibacteria bacterium GW2011_GWB1_46_20]OGF49320.1 MAG: hypothetical protein A2120_03285 [Candidatus Giovannonibact